MNVQEIESEKRSSFSAEFGKQHAVKLLDLQVWDEKDGRRLGEVSFLFGDLMTAQDIEELCEDVADWMGGDLLGTVNLDFAGNRPSLSMMVEWTQDEILRSA